MKFLHAADLHLDTPFVGISDFSKELQAKLKASTYEAARKLFRVALEKEVDFVILAGDIFDDTDIEKVKGNEDIEKDNFEL